MSFEPQKTRNVQTIGFSAPTLEQLVASLDSWRLTATESKILSIQYQTTLEDHHILVVYTE